jgi:hypothetical protein
VQIIIQRLTSELELCARLGLVLRDRRRPRSESVRAPRPAAGIAAMRARLSPLQGTKPFE